MPAPEPDPSSRLAVGSEPVNRRTRRLQPTVAEAQPEAVQQRQQQLRARHALGRPLAAGPQLAQAAAPLPLVARVQAGVGVASLSGALFVSQPLAVGVLVAVGSAGLAWAAHGVWRLRRATGEPGQAPLLSREALQALDGLLHRAAPELPADAGAALQAVKQALAQAQQPGAADRLGMQDRAFVQQCVARYLPDSLEAYLRMPAARRAQPLAPGQPSADEALVQQLMALHEGLQRRLRPQGDEAAEALLRQQRFLDAKSRE
ncbi:hypothetical protein DBR42_24845 [Pelomonas sp. HMWF004]|nr:hypothetical protein DBR42_24845 [Pelomonas sp. HMWF004]